MPSVQILAHTVGARLKEADQVCRSYVGAPFLLVEAEENKEQSPPATAGVLLPPHYLSSVLCMLPVLLQRLGHLKTACRNWCETWPTGLETIA